MSSRGQPKKRNQIERGFNRRKQWRGVASATHSAIYARSSATSHTRTRETPRVVTSKAMLEPHAIQLGLDAHPVPARVSLSRSG